MFKIKLGYTLLEVLATLMIIAISVHASLPLWREQWLLSQDRYLLKQIVSAIEFAQHQALLQRVNIGLCPSGNDMQCSTIWGKNILIFIADQNDLKAEVIKRIQLTSMHGNLFWRTYPRYRSHLLMSSHQLKQNDNGTLWHCHDQTVKWVITFNQSGYTQVTYPDDHGKFPLPGKPLLC